MIQSPIVLLILKSAVKWWKYSTMAAHRKVALDVLSSSFLHNGMFFGPQLPTN